MVRLYEIVEDASPTELKTPKQITADLLKLYCPTTPISQYIINEDGTVHVIGYIVVGKSITTKKLPFTFTKIGELLRV
jgi:hypothetical protein